MKFNSLCSNDTPAQKRHRCSSFSFMTVCCWCLEWKILCRLCIPNWWACVGCFAHFASIDREWCNIRRNGVCECKRIVYMKCACIAVRLSLFGNAHWLKNNPREHCSFNFVSSLYLFVNVVFPTRRNNESSTVEWTNKTILSHWVKHSLRMDMKITRGLLLCA